MDLICSVSIQLYNKELKVFDDAVSYASVL